MLTHIKYSRILIVCVLCLIVSAVLLVVNMNKETVDEPIILQTEYEKAGINIRLNESSNKLEVINTSGDVCTILIEKGDDFRNYIVETHEIIPLQMGDGEYTVKIYTKYRNKLKYLDKTTIEALNTQDITMYLDAQYYGDYSKCTEELFQISKRLMVHTNTQEEFIENCYKYVCEYEYNETRQKEIERNQIKIYKPDIQNIIDEQSGICLDKACLMASILRLNDIPTKVVSGNVGNEYHAWVEVLINEEWKYFDPTLKTNYSDFNYEEYEIVGIN